jgi:hypothetical protein
MIAVVASVALAAAAAAPGAAELKFHAPEGWTDLSRGAPEANFARVPAKIAELARTGGFAAVAYQGRRTGATMFVKVQDGTFAINGFMLAAMSKGIEMLAKANGTKMRLLSSDIRNIGGVPVGRAIYALNGNDLRQLVYFIPGRQKNAALTYTVVTEDFDEMVAALDEAAAKTEGVHQGASTGVFQEVFAPAIGALAVCAIGGAILLVLHWRRRAKAS